MPNFIGSPVKRVEDKRFITGKGRYTDDIVLPGMTYACIVRSEHAHARIKAIDTSAAEAVDGVLAVFTGQDMVDDGIQSIPTGWAVGDAMKEPPHYPLAVGKVHHVGDGVAVVIATDKATAQDAAEQVMIEYEPLPAVVDATAALAPDAPIVHDGLDSNLCFDWELGDRDATDRAMAAAHHVTTYELVNQRVVPNAIEPRSAIGHYDPAREELTLYTSSQNPHLIRLLLCAFVWPDLPEHKVRVVSPDVGGGFGSKIFHYPEEVICAWASKKLERPVKWTAARSESFVTDAHGRDHVSTAELGLDAEGNMVALRVKTVANLGAYLSTFAPAVPTYLYGTLLAGQYRTPHIHVNVKGVFTNTVPVDAYRGAGRPEATFLVERVVELAAKELGMDPAELRRKNFIRPDEFPYDTPVALQYDSGNYEGALDKALEMIGYEDFRREQAEARKQGRLLGIGFSSYIEACGIAPSQVVGALGARAGLYESGGIRVHPTGKVEVFTGTHSHGQGHETTFAQIVAHELGIPLENVEVVHGDTSRVPFGMGTYGSRSLAVGGSAIMRALDKVKDKARKIAAHKLEAAEEDVEFVDGTFRVKGTDRTIGFGDVALTAYVPHDYPEGVEPGLDENAFYDPKNFTFPFGTHICTVEVDPDTGVVRILRYVAVDDVGNIINPMIVEGQIHGGIAQGVGQALFEGAVYDETGQPLTGSYMDYTMPRADDLPSFEVGHQVTPCPHNPLGVKGAGEAGTIASTACVVNAVVDALYHRGIRDIPMPLTPERVWRALHAGGDGAAAAAAPAGGNGQA
ncbi:MAG: xanthine dehydrogenase family protein molybdopterin-binding subunit [Bacteroidetes bacterium]|nr:carbon monoxide dehydrogenase [Rhodothermaceae bacterium RA]RMH49892.1 MAG: xanthine dehydrogenase family protein molybdopterin-binding subunit [Bacteroidota bacterium]